MHKNIYPDIQLSNLTTTIHTNAIIVQTKQKALTTRVSKNKSHSLPTRPDKVQ